MGRRQVEYFKERGRHRFGVKYLPNFFFLVYTCGMVKCFLPQFKEEGTIAVAALLASIYPTPDDVPQIILYDKACQLWRTIRSMDENNPENVRYLR
mmetsp:Transcript_25995/g.41744  ORF Transcript_25995/g.41744 Transcript_25995/m.41744 type:complete len:96 (-) Transcript_25995:183-470(-)